ncbi:hypothetical protein AYI68_g3614 [Smittium mucronatum]|uniref:Uncharacterized protein n=1 Tax=Smittium mucronatum TaxID=133383 RepID=A0A1R0GZH4_9FUNG|nr:hypothetical protein AYI68_g3614 [Smittium mucronatum]
MALFSSSDDTFFVTIWVLEWDFESLRYYVRSPSAVTELGPRGIEHSESPSYWGPDSGHTGTIPRTLSLENYAGLSGGGYLGLNWLQLRSVSP